MIKTYYYRQVWEYLLLIIPPEDIKHSIGNIKTEVGVKYGSEHALHSAAHISLVRFLLVKGLEQNLLSRLFGFCINKLAFKIQLRNFDVFPRHTLYINVPENKELNKLQYGLTALLTSTALVREKQMRPSRNHYMTVARNLNPVQFDSVSLEYRHREFNSSFPAKDVVLLKRQFDEYNHKSCRWMGSHKFVMGH